MYNGYTNYQTYIVCLWLDNEEDSQREATRMAKAGESLESWVNEMLPELPTSMFTDMLNYALEMVDWDEVQEHFAE